MYTSSVQESPCPLRSGKEVPSTGSGTDAEATAMESDIPTVFYPDKHAKVYFPKGSTKVILEYTEITDNKVHIEFDSVSQCVNYCQNRGMDPLICDCKTMEEGGAR